MSSAPRIVVIQPEHIAPLGLLAPTLADVEVVLVRPEGDELPLPSLDEVDGLVVLGGTMNAYDDEATTWLPSLRAYLRDAVEQDVATLGICLGAQLLAVALGGAVEVGPPAGTERGIIELRLRPDASEDPLLGPVVAALGRDVLAPSDHDDAISALPDGAVWLASSRQYPFQAFRIGSAWGLQFHPEADAETLAAWAEHVGADPAPIRERHAAAAGPLTTLAETVGGAFLARVRDRVAR